MKSNEKSSEIEKLYEMRQKDIQDSINRSLKSKRLSSNNIKPIETLSNVIDNNSESKKEKNRTNPKLSNSKPKIGKITENNVRGNSKKSKEKPDIAISIKKSSKDDDYINSIKVNKNFHSKINETKKTNVSHLTNSQAVINTHENKNSNNSKSKSKSKLLENRVGSVNKKSDKKEENNIDKNDQVSKIVKNKIADTKEESTLKSNLKDMSKRLLTEESNHNTFRKSIKTDGKNKKIENKPNANAEVKIKLHKQKYDKEQNSSNSKDKSNNDSIFDFKNRDDNDFKNYLEMTSENESKGNNSFSLTEEGEKNRLKSKYRTKYDKFFDRNISFMKKK